MWIALAILGFVLWWPLGLAALLYLTWSGSMKCCGFDFERWNGPTRHTGEGRGWMRQPQTSGNRAFDEYRSQTLQRLEEEHRAFQEFLDRLRIARDRSEFDQFMAERAARSESASQDGS